ncbi:MAG: crossover junction endodeoxyribonuclease RuvC [Pseudomonadota bacterium]
MVTIIGIDPGSRITGYGIIESNGQKHRFVACGSIKVTEKKLDLRLQQIFDGIREAIFTHQPEEASVEQVFMHVNPGGALKLGQARGAAIVACAIHAMPVAEYAARQIKQSVVGYGAAKKDQVQHMVKTILNLTTVPQTDAADALAAAICHAHARKLKNMLADVK